MVKPCGWDLNFVVENYMQNGETHKFSKKGHPLKFKTSIHAYLICIASVIIEKHS